MKNTDCTHLHMCHCAYVVYLFVRVCAHAIDRDRKEADLAYLFKSSLTAAEELSCDLQPALEATDLLLHHGKRDSSATHVTRNATAGFMFLEMNHEYYITPYVSNVTEHTHPHTHINTAHTHARTAKNALKLCVQKRLNNLDET